MTHVRIPDFSQSAPVRSTAAPSAARRRLSVDGRYLINLPNERLPGEDEVWEIVEPIRAETPHSRGFRFLELAGELLAAVAIIGGGMVLTGLASLL
ncbi:hypothetical protein [Methylobacterium sp. NEAU K]|uniref:hypothetical protein n=1 Tax=Methylobacterium sp. NEAU K TaxID=3064946 RepID=UPI002735C5D2|nr:hypothetical protein [Methylobacterium sp. NEAU K]MDP4006885.1 hypothetical protein [Methylobacterium sp. NEAU K]